MNRPASLSLPVLVMQQHSASGVVEKKSFGWAVSKGGAAKSRPAEGCLPISRLATKLFKMSI
jgi:hypothetical protein